jgi:phosphatidate phosphatase APP1
MTISRGKKLTILVVSLLSILLLIFEWHRIANKKQVTFYHTYGYQKGDNWIIPMRARVYEPSRKVAIIAKSTTAIAKVFQFSSQQEKENFEYRLGEVFADNQSGEKVKIRFDGDLEEYPGPSKTWRTDKYGLIVDEIEFPQSKATQLFLTQGSSNGWLSFSVVSRGHHGTGRVRLIEPKGRSVISDIDNTIKVTEVPAGKETLVRNTFFRDFMIVPEKIEMYRAWEDASFHYVSGSPWQLNKPLAEFLFGVEKIPEGSFHMSDLLTESRNKIAAGQLDELEKLVAGEEVFYQKLRQIREIIENFPDREFVLVGDSGECDPEVYRIIRNEFPKKVKEIRIRDVVNDWEKDCQKDESKCQRLQGMRIIPAITVKVERTQANAISKYEKMKCNGNGQ